jgi:hypothetical protein
MYFDGSGDYLTIPSNSAQYISTGDFIIEAWVYITSTGRRVIVSQTENSASPYRGWIFYISTTNKLTFEGSNGVSIASSTNFVTNQWVHVAASRVGSTTYLFNNGTIVASGTVSITDFTGNLTIGQFTSSIAGSEFSGYMSCLGLKKTVGIASNFTPSTTPLQTDANTIFLAKGENAAIYDGARKNNIETVGDTKVVSTLSGPFTGQNPIYFDGSGDYLTIANNSNIDLGSGNFTIDGYMYATTGSSPIILAVQRTAANANGLYLTWSNASTMQFYLGGGSWFVGIDQTGFTRAAWNYFQFTRNGSTVTVNRNGTNLNTTTSVTGTVTTGLPLRIGTDYTLTGTGDAHYLSDFRITKKERVNTQQLRPSSEF